MIKILFIGIGGAIGSICRYLLDLLIGDWIKINNFPLGIFIVNIIGCFFIGFFHNIFFHNPDYSNEIKSLVTVGLLGGFTTYSTFKLDIFLMLSKGMYIQAFTYISATLIIGLLALILGNYISKFFI